MSRSRPKPKHSKSKRETESKSSPVQVVLIPAWAASVVRQPFPVDSPVDPTRRFEFRFVQFGYVLINALFVMLFGFGLIGTIFGLSTTSQPLSEITTRDTHGYNQFRQLSHDISQFEEQQSAARVTIASTVQLEQKLSLIQVSLQVGHHNAAVKQMAQLRREMEAYKIKLADATAPPPPIPGSASATALAISLNVPIVLYHYTPPDFNHQLDELQRNGYTTISFRQLRDGLYGHGGLPPKPIILTFDDGFSNQMVAFEDLLAHHMVATYYVMSGGERSHWCVGADRRYGDPSQPPEGCGDAYLRWDEIRQLDKSGIITIGGHTVDHANLASLSADEQRFQIEKNKLDLETQLGHPVKDFAYPYGAFSATTVDLVHRAGYADAVTTIPGTTHSANSVYTLHRVRMIP